MRLARIFGSGLGLVVAVLLVLGTTASADLGDTIRVSVDNNATEANRDSVFPSISADGRYVAYDSVASNLVADDTNNERDVFVHDTQQGTTTRISVHSDGTQGNNTSAAPSIWASPETVEACTIRREHVRDTEKV
ncbi:MAG: hypothetical protein GEU79_11080 [Acidimicrobiia bacterium]|nr:hypothetical protein [Acidimicrobiia bacterium]